MTILETAPIMEYAHAHLWMIFVGFMVGAFGLINAKICFDEDYINASTIFTGIAVIGAILLIVGIICEINEPKTDTGRIKQTIKCDDSISLNEFYNKYKILEHTQYTDIYVVEEIKNGD